MWVTVCEDTSVRVSPCVSVCVRASPRLPVWPCTAADGISDGTLAVDIRADILLAAALNATFASQVCL